MVNLIYQFLELNEIPFQFSEHLSRVSNIQIPFENVNHGKRIICLGYGKVQFIKAFVCLQWHCSLKQYLLFNIRNVKHIIPIVGCTSLDQFEKREARKGRIQDIFICSTLLTFLVWLDI